MTVHLVFSNGYMSLFNRYKMSGELPLLYFNISDEKLKCILKLIDSIPKPESPPDTTSPPQSSQASITEFI